MAWSIDRGERPVAMVTKAHVCWVPLVPQERIEARRVTASAYTVKVAMSDPGSHVLRFTAVFRCSNKLVTIIYSG